MKASETKEASNACIDGAEIVLSISLEIDTSCFHKILKLKNLWNVGASPSGFDCTECFHIILKLKILWNVERTRDLAIARMVEQYLGS